jgi:hypothetical protein
MTKAGFEHWLNAVRIDLYHETKTMTNAAAVVAINESGKSVADNHGIAIAQLEPIRKK